MPTWARNDLVFERNKNCDRCGRVFHENELTMQEGYWVCHNCYDELNEHDLSAGSIMR